MSRIKHLCQQTETNKLGLAISSTDLHTMFNVNPQATGVTASKGIPGIQKHWVQNR